MKSDRIRSFSCPYFCTFGLNTDQKNSEDGQFSRSSIKEFISKLSKKESIDCYIFYYDYYLFSKSDEFHQILINTPQVNQETLQIVAVKNL